MKHMRIAVFSLLIPAFVAGLSAQNPPPPGQGRPGPEAAKKYPDGEKIWTTLPIQATVLPKDAPIQRLTDIMMDWKAAIGGHCVTCHTVTTDREHLNAMGNPEIMLSPYEFPGQDALASMAPMLTPSKLLTAAKERWAGRLPEIIPEA